MRRISALIFFVALLAMTGKAETFRNPHRLPLPITPNLLLHGDLNGDGREDLLYGDPSTKTVHILLNQGGGRYLAAPIITLPANTYDDCYIGDFNGDHRLDLACSQSVTPQASVVLFSGQGDGTFGAPQFLPLPASSYPYFDLTLVSPGDLNGDGVPDLFGIAGSNGVAWAILSDGHGGFTIGTQTSVFGAGAFDAFLDVNGDGKLDALLDGPTVALGNGDGTFGPQHSSNGFQADNCTFGDLDHDGHPDAACTFAQTTDGGNAGDLIGGYTLAIFHGNSDGTFNPTAEFTQTYGDHSNGFEGFGTVGVPVSILDLNGDGQPDIVTSAPDGTTVFLGQPGPGFAAPLHFATGFLNRNTFFFADTNGDSLPDLVALGPNGIYISYGRPDGTLDTAPAYEVTGIVSYTVTADFSGDGIPDIIASGDNHLAISLGKGDGTFLPYKNLDTGAVHFNGYNTAMDERIVRGDFNGDGKQDLLAFGAVDPASVDPHPYYMQGNGDGTFQRPVQIGANDLLLVMYDLLRVADVNHDGRDDIINIPSTTDGTLSVQLSNGDGTFTTKISVVPQESYGIGSPFFWPDVLPAAADFDRDGKLDLVTAAQSNVYVLHGNGDGTFITSATLPIPQLNVSMGDSLAVATGDFDGDGKADIAVLWGTLNFGEPQFFTLSQTLVYYGNGDGTFSAPVLAETGNNSFATLDAADLNQDGRAEIILRAEGSLNGGTGIAVVHGLTNRTFISEVNYVAGAGLSSLDIIDLNHDGFPDLVFSNGDYNGHGSSATVLLNLGNAPTVAGTLTATPEPSVTGAPFTLTAALLAPDSSALTGPIQFLIDDAPVGSASLTTNVAGLPITTALTIGVHTLEATWPGNTAFPTPVTLTGTHTVTGLLTTLTLTADRSSAALGQPIQLTAVLGNSPADPPTSALPTGTVSLASSAPIASGGNVTATGLTLTASTSFSSAGTQTITATYPGDSTHRASSATLTVDITALPSTTTVALTPEPSTYGQPVVFSSHVSGSNTFGLVPSGLVPSGQVQFTFCRGAQHTETIDAAGNVLYSSVQVDRITEPVGTCSVYATYLGDTHFAPSTSPTIPYIVVPAPSTTALSATPNPALFGQRVDLTATVAGVLSPTADPVTGLPIPPSSIAIAGAILFFDGSTPLGTVSIAGSTATLTTSNLAIGAHTLTAVYPGDPNLGSSTSAPITLTVLPCSAGFTVQLLPSSLTLHTGASATTTVALSSTCAFSGPLALTAGKLAAPAILTFSPSAVTLTPGAQGTAILTLNTQRANSPTTSALRGLRLPVALATLLFFPAVFRRRSLASLFTLLLFTTVLLSLTGCGELFYYNPPVTPGTYTIPITATDLATGNTQTATLTVTILP